MMKNKHTRKTIAVFCFLVLFLANGQAQGPITPEASSFEPIDATDMVNLPTGDFSYVLPLIEVPSPEGGYPIVLSYHAGIALDQEASWVGLGWNINVGSISRSVNGIPDDWKNSKISSIVHDVGGSNVSHQLSVGVGFGEGGNFSAGLYASYSENKSFNGENSYNFNWGVSMGIGEMLGGANLKLGTDGYGYGISSVLKTSSLKGIGIGSSIGLSYHSESGVSLGLGFNAGAKINATGTSTGASALSFSSGSSSSINIASSSNNSNLSTELSVDVLSGFTLPINVGLFSINYSYRKLRYWIFDKKVNYCAGSLYPKSFSNINQLDKISHKNKMFDCYKSFYDSSNLENFTSNNFSFISYDSYSVSGQGISGYISPMINEFIPLKYKFEKLKINNDDKVIISRHNKILNSEIGSSNNIYFYFKGLNESYLRGTTSNWENLPNNIDDFYEIKPPTFSLKTEVNINGIKYDNFNSATKRKGSSSFIESYTNAQIKANPSLIFESDGFDRKDKKLPEEGIGAFKITTPDGKTYHYSIPVYHGVKFIRSTEPKSNIDKKFYEQFQTDPYAINWLLTAITGSDYVDNGDGKISDDDLGYWVKFNYGKWSDGYSWRSPLSKTDYNISPSHKSYAWGVKELYYLNSVRTRTHTAFFVKSERLDSKSIFDAKNDDYISDTDGLEKFVENKNGNAYIDWLNSGIEKIKSFLKLTIGLEHNVKINFENKSHKALKLEKIILIKNDDIPSNLAYTNSSEKPSTIKSSINLEEGYEIYGSTYKVVECKPFFNVNLKGEYLNNVLDVNDLKENSLNLEEKAISVIDFQHDYKLASNTPTSSAINKGRLTLKKLFIKGKKGISTIPPYKFEYHNNKSYNFRNKDDWGYNKDSPEVWSLSKIYYPIGTEMSINYEPDDFIEAVDYNQVFKNNLAFDFYNFEGKLRIDVSKKEVISNIIDFTDYFESNSLTSIDIWAYLMYKYRWGLHCNSRTGSVSIPNRNVKVVSVDKDKIILETDLKYTNDYNGGMSKLYNTTFSYDMDNLTSNQAFSKPKVDGCRGDLGYTLNYKLESNKDPRRLQKGGGLRVKNITLQSNGKSYETNYYYNTFGFDEKTNSISYKTSGVTSYAPSRLEKNIKYITELPSPTVLYSNVTIQKEDEKTLYYFKNLNNYSDKYREVELDDIFSIKLDQQNVNYSLVEDYNREVSRYKYKVMTNFSSLGKLLKIERLNSENQIISKIENKYKPITDIEQGVTQESFYSYGTATSFGSVYYHLNTSTKISYPSVLESVTKTENGIRTTTEFNKYDFNSGQVLEKRIIDANGKAIITKTIPAYREYSKMGAKSDDIHNKNMLSQSAANYTYKYLNNSWKPIGANIQTWKNSWNYLFNDGTKGSTSNIWRKHKTHIWNGSIDSTGVFTNFTDFDFTNGATNENWKKTSEVTKYDQFSHPLETKDINDNYVSSKMGDQYSKIIATANTHYNDMYYSGAEYVYGDYFDGGIKSVGYKKDSNAHTGQAIVEINKGQNAFEVTVPKRSDRKKSENRFKVSVWVRKGQEHNVRIKLNDVIHNFNSQEKVTAGNWVLLNGYIQLSSTRDNTIAITSTSGTIQLDDFRLHPAVASMTSYVYNEWDELSHMIGSNGLATKYVYDAAGRLIETYQEVVDGTDGQKSFGGFEKVKEMNYNYKGTALLDKNANGIIDGREAYDPIVITFVNNDLYSGALNTSVTISVSGGSGEFMYSFAQGRVSGSAAEVSQQVRNLVFGPYTTNYLTNTSIPCDSYDGKYVSNVIKVKVKDLKTGATKEGYNYYGRSCDDNNPSSGGIK